MAKVFNIKKVFKGDSIMEKLKRFLDCYIPTETCNLRCHYCYIAQMRNFNNKLAQFKCSPEVIRKALSKERLGGTCLINFCAGGETLLEEEVVRVLKALLEEGHYVMVVTNGTLTQRINEILEFDSELLKRLFFKFSFHYLELLKRNLMETYFENVKKVRSSEASFTIELTPSDELIPYIEDVKKVCMENLGALCHVTIARDERTKDVDVLSKYSFEEYKKIWGTFDSALFDFKASIFYKKRKEFCYAGDWSLYINLGTGDMKQCYWGRPLDNIYKNIDKPLNFKALGHNCTLPHCWAGHAFLTLGNIPELDTVTYAETRNRIDSEGRTWLKPQMEQFMKQKLKYNNEEYSFIKKEEIAIENDVKYISEIPKKIANRIKDIKKDK